MAWTPDSIPVRRSASMPMSWGVAPKQPGRHPSPLASIVAGQWAFHTGIWGGCIARLRTKVDLADSLGD